MNKELSDKLKRLADEVMSAADEIDGYMSPVHFEDEPNYLALKARRRLVSASESINVAFNSMLTRMKRPEKQKLSALRKLRRFLKPNRGNK